ncbi:GNAT family N-acetyltransferase [Phytoactinopolyspora mesophila]|uniref:GNAT family N-acetyltransferase n=1 Tax=Phytoactinopolyspora mesophila TaxID=2650750 RepID=A0A7K3LY37_9ACTN|nr:GNAT family N-acetyltransferase [Phytoactinopolyspora mesophila]NDL55572.1 GNAT family N-acetyltransferase [Phytoactinopolyspora mesophila]
MLPPSVRRGDVDDHLSSRIGTGAEITSPDSPSIYKVVGVATEIRAFKRSEAIDYLKVLPYANGLPHWEPAPAAWYGGSAAWPPRQPMTQDQLEAAAEKLMASERFHPQAAFVDGRLVGASAMLSFEITVPGLNQLPMGGVTATGVVATHRRRGLLRGMIQAMFDEALDRGEPVAALSASEGSIYGRFGFSPATVRTRWEIERPEATLREAEQPPGSLELVDAAMAREAWPAVHDIARKDRVGELSARAGQWAGLSDEADGTDDGPLRYLIHRTPEGDIDGIANFRLPWSPRLEDTGTLIVEALQATNNNAYRALWQLLLDFDLTKRIVAAPRPADEPLRWMLHNPRALRVTRQSDNLWVRLLEVPTALESRSYDVAGGITLTIDDDAMCPANTGTWRLDAGPDGATCARTNAQPDLTLDIQALSSLYLGGVSAALLASADRIRPHRPEAVTTLSRLFRVDPEPFNSFAF